MRLPANVSLLLGDRCVCSEMQDHGRDRGVGTASLWVRRAGTAVETGPHYRAALVNRCELGVDVLAALLIGLGAGCVVRACVYRTGRISYLFASCVNIACP